MTHDELPEITQNKMNAAFDNLLFKVALIGGITLMILNLIVLSVRGWL